MNKKRLWLGLSTLGVTLLSAPSWGITLEDAIKEALHSNPQVRASQSEMQARELEVDAATAEHYPSVDLSASVGREYSNNPTTRALQGNDDFYDLTRTDALLTVRQPLFKGFATVSEVDRREALHGAATHGLASDADAVAQRTAQVYLDVLRTREIVALAQQFVAAHEDVFNRIQRRSASGVGRRADLEQARGRLALAQANLIAAQANMYDAVSNYQRVVGTKPPADLSAAPDMSSRIPTSLEQALDSVAAANPDLLAAQSDVEAAQAEMRATRSRFYPELDVVLNRRWGEDLDGVEGDDEDYGAYLELSYNLFNGGGDTARQRASAYRVTRAQDVRDDTYRQVRESIRIAWNAYESVKAQIPSLEQHAQSSVDTRDAYQSQFSIGQRTLLDLLDTENELFEARRALTNARYNRLYAQYRILTEMGRLRDLLMDPGASASAGVSSQ